MHRRRAEADQPGNRRYGTCARRKYRERCSLESAVAGRPWCTRNGPGRTLHPVAPATFNRCARASNDPGLAAGRSSTPARCPGDGRSGCLLLQVLQIAISARRDPQPLVDQRRDEKQHDTEQQQPAGHHVLRAGTTGQRGEQVQAGDRSRRSAAPSGAEMVLLCASPDAAPTPQRSPPQRRPAVAEPLFRRGFAARRGC